LGQVQKRVSDSTARPFLFRITDEGREFLLEEGTDQRYGARHLKRAIERYLVSPIARLLATAQVRPGDVLLIDRHPCEEELAFIRDTDERPSYAQMPFVASNSMHLMTAEARG
jgi:ATP-dependent Clp protease ATP-binding subunit ClpB